MSKTIILKKRKLPASWYKAAGILRGRRRALEKHVTKIRQGWR